MSGSTDRGTVRVGTSGWQYDDWRGAFYPTGVAERRWFEYYATRFPTVEINATFYRVPKSSTVEYWHDRAPDRFRFAVKGSRYLTHNKKLNDPDEPVATIAGRMAPLKAFHGVWLWQLPPNLHLDVKRLERFLDALPGGPGHALEFRHRSCYVDDVAAALPLRLRGRGARSSRSSTRRRHSPTPPGPRGLTRPGRSRPAHRCPTRGAVGWSGRVVVRPR